MVIGVKFLIYTMENSTTCTCQDIGVGNKICVICNLCESHPLSEIDRRANCRIHRVIACCGMPEFVCQSCKDVGWYSTAGWGGPTRHMNEKTGEEKPVKRLKGDIF